MARVDPKRLKTLIEEIQKKHGPESIGVLRDRKIAVEFTPTGFETLDYAFNGGLPKGRIIQFYGPESSGKTSLAYALFNLFPVGMLVDAELSYTTERGVALGVDQNKLIHHIPDCAEEALETVIEASRSGVPFIVLDSVASLVPTKENENDDLAKAGPMAARARLLSRALPQIATAIYKSGTTLILINQVRANMDAMLFGDTTVMPGGHALKHWSSMIVKMGRKEWLKVSGQPLGQTTKLIVTKSKVGDPRREAEMTLIFDTGFLRDRSPDNIKNELKASRVRHLKEQRVVVDDEEQTPSVDFDEEVA